MRLPLGLMNHHYARARVMGRARLEEVHCDRKRSWQIGPTGPISTQLEMPELINESVPSTAHFTGIETAIAYWSAPDVRQRSTMG